MSPCLFFKNHEAFKNRSTVRAYHTQSHQYHHHITITITSTSKKTQHQFLGIPPQKKINIKFQGYHDWPSAASPLPPRLGATLARCCLSIPQIDRLKARSEPGWRSPRSQWEWVSRGRGDIQRPNPEANWARLWFQYFLFSPRKLGEDEPNLTVRIFFKGVAKNHQPVSCFGYVLGGSNKKPSRKVFGCLRVCERKGRSVWKASCCLGQKQLEPGFRWQIFCVNFCRDLFWMCGWSYEFGAKYQPAINLQLLIFSVFDFTPHNFF